VQLHVSPVQPCAVQGVLNGTRASISWVSKRISATISLEWYPRQAKIIAAKTGFYHCFSPAKNPRIGYRIVLLGGLPWLNSIGIFRRGPSMPDSFNGRWF